MKNNNKIKILLLIFILYSVYAGHRELFNDLPNKLSNIVSVPAETETAATDVSAQVQAENINNDSRILDIKFSSKEEGSIVQRWFVSVLNWVLDNPRGKAIFKEVALRMLEQQGRIIGHDLLASRYLVQEDNVGTGKEASCADIVEINYNIKTEGAEPQGASVVTLALGSGNMPQGLENGIIGMKEGGKRTITYRSSNVLSKAGRTANNLTAEVTLLSVKQKEPRKNIFGMPFFNKPAQPKGELPLLCGDMVYGLYSITKLDGKVVLDSKDNSQAISFKIGSDEYPNELSDAIIGLPARGAEVFFITTLNTAKAALNPDKKDSRPFPADYPVLLQFKLQERK
jgi:FKBP-type peptidyl-prolyl cis-trans isomerase 2